VKNAKPSVMHLRGSEFYGSPERLIIGQTRYLDSFNCLCVSYKKPDKTNDFLEELDKQGIPSAAVEDNRLFDPHIPGRLREIISSRKVDLLVSHEYKSNFYGYLATRKIDIPQVAYFHGWTAECLRMKFYNWLDRMILPRLGRVITISEATRNLLRQSGISGDKIHVVYNAIEMEEDFRPPPKITNKKPIIGVVGRLSFEKGLHILLEALAGIKKEAPSFLLEVYGFGPEKSRLERMVRALGLSDMVSFKGFVADTEQIYKRLNFLVIPSLSEGHPMVILEAWRQAIGVVASRAGGIPEIIEDGKTGLLADVGDSRGLGQAILKGLKNPELMTDFGKRGFELIGQKYNFRYQAERLTEIYKDVLGLGQIRED